MQFNDLGKQWETIREVCLQKVDELGHDGGYIGGKRVEEFENEFANYIGTKYAIGVSNGTDALKLALQSFDLDDRDCVIMPANTFIADYIAVKHLPQTSKPTVILVDHDENFCIDVKALEDHLKKYDKNFRRTVVIAVHLYGSACDMDALLALKDQYFFHIIEDCSQSHGTKYKDRMTGTFGDLATFSLYPGKNLGALGDAGIITTNNSFLCSSIKALRNYGSFEKYHYSYIGHNNRLDPIQCIFLSEKLKHLNEWNQKRRVIADRYLQEIKTQNSGFNIPIGLPKISDDVYHTFHVFCVSVPNREEFMNRLKEKGIPTLIHYPIPIHTSKIWDKKDRLPDSNNLLHLPNTTLNMNCIVSLPIHPFMTEEEVTLVIQTINEV